LCEPPHTAQSQVTIISRVRACASRGSSDASPSLPRRDPICFAATPDHVPTKTWQVTLVLFVACLPTITSAAEKTLAAVCWVYKSGACKTNVKYNEMVVLKGALPTNYRRNADLICNTFKPITVLKHEPGGDKDNAYLLVLHESAKGGNRSSPELAATTAPQLQGCSPRRMAGML
jgi:hypothetical protein